MPLLKHRHWLITACLFVLSLLPAEAKTEFTPEETKKFQEQKLAAEKGDSSAQLQLGHCYYNGWGVEKNEAEAEKWYKMSAEQGNVTAKFYLQSLRKEADVAEAKSSDTSSARTEKTDQTEDDSRSRLILKSKEIQRNLHPTHRYNYGQAMAFAAWIIGMIVAFFLNIAKRSSLEKDLSEDIRFKARFLPCSKHYPAQETPSKWSSGWITAGVMAATVGFIMVIGLNDIGVVLGLMLIVGGAALAIYDFNHDISQQRLAPGNHLSEAKFEADRILLCYSISGQREFTFRPGLKVWLETRETFRDGVGFRGENHAQVLTGLGLFCTFSDESGSVQLEIDFPGMAEFLALCRHKGAEVKLSPNIDERIASRLAATPSWQPGWEPCEADLESETDKVLTNPKLWNPTATAIWSFLLCPAFGSWLQAANWRELGNPEKARRCMVWFYGFIVYAIAYVFILPYFLLTPEFLDYTWSIIFFVIWYLFSGKEQIRHVRESQQDYEKKGWLKPILTFCVIFAAWLGLCVGSDEFFQASLRAASFRGDPSAQRVLAWKYANGKDVTEDQEEASRLFRKAAEQGDQYAQAALGVRLQEGIGTPKNRLEAFKWFRLSANQGNDVAQNMLGVCYFYGLGTEKNYGEAAKWYRRSAENGNAEAQNQLGRCYFNGHGVNKDLVESLKWHRMAADQGDAEAQYIVGLKHAAGSGTDKNPAEALKWYLRSANQDYADAQHQLGESYAEGIGATKDINEAIKWYKKAAERGNLSAQLILGKSYSGGKGVTRDKREAAKWLLKAAEQGSAFAQSYIGIAYEGGDGVDMNQFEAVKWFRKAAEQGDMFGQLGLGIHLVAGYGVNQDQAAGLAMIRKSAGLGNAYAYMTLGDYHATGKAGLTKDLVEAYAHLSLAGVTLEKARNELADLEKKMDAQSISKGKKRALELKKEIDAKRAAPQPAK